MADPQLIRPERWTQRLRGRWLYGGHWMNHFGHFLTETVTTLWPEDLEPVNGLVFHRYLSPRPVVHPWQQRLVDLAGYPGLPIRLVNDRQVRVDELVVPSRSIVQHGWGFPGAAAVYQRIAEAVPEQAPPWPATEWPSNVYLSRTSHNAAIRERGRKEPRSTRGARRAARRGLRRSRVRGHRPPDVVDRGPGPPYFGVRGCSPDRTGRRCTSRVSLDRARACSSSATGAGRPVGVGTQRVINTLSGHSEAFLRYGLGRDQLVAALQELGVWKPDPVPAHLADRPEPRRRSRGLMLVSLGPR